MRDPERIQELLGLVKQIWLKDPDLRFNQLLYILQRDYSDKNNGVGEVKEIKADDFTRIGFDFFNVEDDVFIGYLRCIALDEKNTK